MSHLNYSPSTEINLEALKPTITINSNFKNSPFSDALKDVIDGTLLWRLWSNMAITDIHRRYRRTILGPFWTTLSLAIFIGCMGILFSYLWKTDLANFLPFFCSGFICWTFISTIIVESCMAFVSAEGLLKQICLPYSIFAYLTIFRNLIVLAHHAVVYVLVIMIFPVPLNANLLLILPGVFFLCLTGLWVAILIGLICARYRDLQQVVNSILQISLFITPIFWPPSQLAGTRATLFFEANPLYHYVNVIRMPLLGQAPELMSWVVVLTITCLGWLFTLYFFGLKRKKLIFWL